MNTVAVGVLAIQGDVREHIARVGECGARPVPVRTVADIEQCAGLIIPGGESTTIGLLMDEAGLREWVAARVVRDGFPVFGTCAGLILLAKEVQGRAPRGLALMDVTVARNAFGRQVASFEAELEAPLLGPGPYRGVFIRAPRILRIGPEVTVLARYLGEPVAVEQGSLLGASFHPELTPDQRLHRYFLKKVERFAATAAGR